MNYDPHLTEMNLRLVTDLNVIAEVDSFLWKNIGKYLWQEGTKGFLGHRKQ